MKKLSLLNKSTAIFTLLALIVGSFGLTFAKANAEVISVTTNPATVVTSTDATLNGTNGAGDATGHSFWASTAPFDTSSTTLPTGVFSTPDLGTISAGATFSALLSSVAGLPAITPGTTYYFAAWSDVGGTWMPGDVNSLTTDALPGTLAAQDFGVMDVSNVKGYTAGFGVTDATLAGATSVVAQLYSGTTLLQTDTAIIPAFNADITGTQFSTPFDVFGTFDYPTDGYWTNVRAAEYGQTLIPTSVVATVTLANGKVVTATNTNLTGDPTTIFPPPVENTDVTTNPATVITSTDATLNGTNGTVAATGHSFWVSLTPFVTTSTTLPTGVFSSADFGAVASNTPFGAQLSGVVGLPAITPATTYYFAAWSLIGSTWTPGAVLSFETGPSTELPGSLAAQDFTSMNSIGVNGYKAVFNLSDATLLGATSIVTQLYSGATLLQTDTGIVSPASKFSTDNGTQFSALFDVFGTFDYPADGYWTNVRAAEYGQTLTPTSAVATVTLANGKVVTATNSNLNGVDGTISGTVTSGSGILHVDSITSSPSNANGIADGSYTHGWSYVFHITAPTNEPNLSMKFADWLNGANILPVANNMRISSAQATVTTPVTLTAANLYSSPALVMTGDLDTGTAGRQVDVLVEVQIPVSTINGAYSTSYGINTN